MLSFFPQVRDEESTYSIFARLQFALQPPNIRIMGTLLFNREHEVGRLNFQNSFDYLCRNLPSNFTPKLFLYNNTIFPLYIPFLSIEKQEKALEYFASSYPDKINRCLTITNINNNRTYIRVCKECIKEDFINYGEPYYRRQHEIELNRICYKHKTPLYEYTIFNYDIPRRYENCYTVLSDLKEIHIPEEFKQKFLNISEDISTIFQLNLEDWNIEVTKKKLFTKLKENGYFSANGERVIFQTKLCEDFMEYYSEKFLNYIGYSFDINSSSGWIRKIARKRSVDNPLKFILFIRFLFGSFIEFYQYNQDILDYQEFSAFRKSAYPCLNNICPNYNKLVIKDITKISKSYGIQVAMFKCDYCGFTYTQRVSDENNNDIYVKSSIKDRGHLWHNKLKECIDKELTLTEISVLLNSNCNQISSYIKKYKNSNLIVSDEAQIDYKPDNSLVQEYKNEVLRFLNKNPNANRLSIYQINRKIYSYLLANDKDWICTIIPANSNNKSSSKKETINNYWSNRDEFLSEELVKAINKIKTEKTPYKRITIFILQKYIGYANLNRNRYRLPKCFKILDEVCETTLDYQKRRIKYIMKEMHNNNIKITATKILYTANLDIRDNIEEIHAYAEMMVKEYNKGNVKIIENIDDFRI